MIADSNRITFASQPFRSLEAQCRIASHRGMAGLASPRITGRQTHGRPVPIRAQITSRRRIARADQPLRSKEHQPPLRSLSQRMSRYSPQLKRRVVGEQLNAGKSVTDICLEYHVSAGDLAALARAVAHESLSVRQQTCLLSTGEDTQCVIGRMSLRTGGLQTLAVDRRCRR